MSKLIPLKLHISTDKYRNIRDLYLCVCGNQFVARRAGVKCGRVKSCGCLKSELISKAQTTHGMTRSVEHNAWQNMIQRCTNPNTRRYKHYGGRGITICDTWKLSFEAFYLDMGPRPLGMSLDRIDNDKGYFKDNCRWTTIDVQNRNKRQRGKKETE